MAIAPIAGKLRKRFWVDLTTSLGLGIGAGYAYWFVLSDTRLPPIQRMLTKPALGMACISRAVSPNTRHIFPHFLTLLSVQKHEEYYYKLEQAKKAEQS